MTDRNIEKLEKAKWLLIEAMDDKTTKYERERLETIIIKIEKLQHH